MTKHNVWLCQANFAYGQSLFLPYSVGVLEAYARAQKAIDDAFTFCGYIARREPIDQVLARIEQSGGVDVLGISVYLWNEQYSRALADAVRARYRHCLIVIGGPQVPKPKSLAAAAHPGALVALGGAAVYDGAHGQSPDREPDHGEHREGHTGDERAFQSQPQGTPFESFSAADIAVYGEGELAFAAILQAYADARRQQQHPGAVQRGDQRRDVYGAIAGLAVATPSGDAPLWTGEPERIADLAQLPSPYLAGCFDALLDDRTIDWQACSETHRGCPFSCTFCDWGSATYTKVRQFPDSRIIAEYEWFGRNQIRYVYNCDANYGLLPRDIPLTEVLVETKRLFSFPKEFRACYAKNSNDRVFTIASLLNEAQMSKGVTLSFQSMDAHTQQIIRRSNIKLDHFRDTLQRYRKAGIVTYTELILGLPGESRRSFMDGVDTLLDAGQHDGINMYLCQVLPNSELNDPAYREAHKIADVRSPLLLQHSAPAIDPHQEHNDIITSTATMSRGSWAETYMLAWSVQTFHCLGLAKFLAMFCRHELGMRYTQFYEELRTWAGEHKDSQIGQEYHKTLDVLSDGMNGGNWGQVDQRFGNVVWPTEELSFLRLISRHEAVYIELRTFLQQLLQRCSYTTTLSLVNALIDYQHGMVVRPDKDYGEGLELPFNCHAYFTALMQGEPIPCVVQDESLMILPTRTYESLEEFARFAVWYGRKGGRFTEAHVIYYSHV